MRFWLGSGRWLVLPAGSGDSETEQDESEKAPEDKPSESRIDAQAQQFRDSVKEIRKRTDLVGKGIVGLGTALISVASLVELTKVFPYPEAAGGAWIFLILGGVLFVVGLLTVFSLYMFAQKPMVMVTDMEHLDLRKSPVLCGDDLDCGYKAERRLVEQVFDGAAVLNGAANLQTLESRGRRLARVAERLPEGEERKRTEKESEEISSVVNLALWRALHAVVLERANRATRGRLAMFSYSLALAGLVLAFTMSSYISAEQQVVKDTAEENAVDTQLATEKAIIENAKACAEAASGGVKIKKIIGVKCPPVKVTKPKEKNANKQTTAKSSG